MSDPSRQQTTPTRIQRKRTKGWRMPEGAIYVGAPTIFGNPFIGPKASVRFLDWLLGRIGPKRFMEMERRPFYCHHDRERVLNGLPKLRGHNLAYWCSPDEPCHADVLLMVANQ